MTASVPAVGHFVWLGRRLSALGYLSVRSALQRAGLDRVALHVEHPQQSSEDPLVRDLLGRPGFALERLDAGEADGADGLPPDTWSRLLELDRTLDRPASRANLLRLQILWRQGGVYLDTDAIVLRSLRELCDLRGFAGLERVAMPAALADSKNPLRWARAGALLAVRHALSYRADAGRAFSRIEGLFDLACNNAVIGAAPRHATIGRLLTTAAQMDRDRALRRYQLGPRLLEEVTGNGSTPAFHLFAPDAFYPLAPEICWDYLRDDPERRLGDRPDPRSYVAHLYDSVLLRRLGGPVDVPYLLRSRGRTLLTRMVDPYLDDLAAATGAA